MEDNNDTKTKTEDSSSPLFFNVMPKKNLASPIIAPSVKIEGEEAGSANGLASSQGQEASNTFFQKYKKSIILILVFIILISGGYYAYTKYVETQYKSESILINPNNLTEKNHSANEVNAINPAIEGVSTPADWQKKYFKEEKCDDLSICGDIADPDMDGLPNSEEFKLTSDPNNEDSDLDGLSDGDEAMVFGTDPMNKNTANDPNYDDTAFIKDGYDVKTGKLFTPERLKEIKTEMDKYSLHPKTIATLGEVAKKMYGFGVKEEVKTNEPNTSTTTPVKTDNALEGFDQSPEAKLERDMQRQNTIKSIGVGLVRYHQDQNEYPKTQNFAEMYQKIKLYIKVAVNITDPVNKEPYVYSYYINTLGNEFTLTYFSESLNTQIKKKTAESEKDRTEEDAAIYDNQRTLDLNSLQMALKLYSDGHIAGNQDYVFPSKEKYKSELVPVYINDIPKDPKTKEDYSYEVSETFDSFTLKAIFDKPKTGKTGYLCNQEECRDY